MHAFYLGNDPHFTLGMIHTYVFHVTLTFLIYITFVYNISNLIFLFILYG